MVQEVIRVAGRELERPRTRWQRLLDEALGEPVFLTEADLADVDFDIPEAWQIKLTPAEAEPGFTESLITPQGEEVSFEDVFLIEGEWMTRTQMEALAPVALPTPQVPPVIPEELFATSDEELLYRNYQRTGGAFDLEAWRMIGSPLYPAETDINTLLDEIFEVGRTPETEALLRRMAPEITEEDIEGFFAPEVAELTPLPIPPEGIAYTIEDEEGNPIDLRVLEDWEFVGTERRLRSKDLIIFSEGKEVGRYKAGIGEFVPTEPTWWEKTLGVAFKVIDWALVVPTLIGIAGKYPKDAQFMAKELASDRLKKYYESFPKGFYSSFTEYLTSDAGFNVYQRFVNEALPEAEELAKNWMKEALPGGELHKRFRELPMWEQMLYEAPFWAFLGLTGASALSARAALGTAAVGKPLVTRAGIQVARGVLAPVAGYEKALGFALQQTVGRAFTATRTKLITLAMRANLKKLGITLPRGTEANILKAYRAEYTRLFEELLKKQFTVKGLVVIPEKEATRWAALLATRLKPGRVAAEIYGFLVTEVSRGVQLTPGVIASAAKQAAAQEVKNITALMVVQQTAVGAGAPTITALTKTTDAIIARNLALSGITADFIAGFVPKGIVLEKTASLIAQLKDLGHTAEAISAMKPEEAWANLFKAPVEVEPVVAPITEVTPPEALITPPPTIPGAVVTPAVEVAKPSVVPRAEVGMPEAGLQPSMLPEEVAPKEVRPPARAEVVQAKLDDYLKLQKYTEAQATNRIDEINKLLATKGRLPKGTGTRAEISNELARLEAQQDIAGLTNAEQVQELIEAVENELGLRAMPYHGREPNAFPQYTSKQLDEMLKVYQEARNQLLPEGALKPVPTLSATTPEEAATNLATPGSPTLTPAQVDRTLSLFGKYITDPTTQNAWELTRELRRETRAGRAENLKDRSQQLIIQRGVSPEEAIKQAIRETMSGELPIVRADYLDDLTQEMRDVLFNKVYHTLKDEPFEMMSTTEALTNALLGKPIPRELGIKGGSAYTRLQRVFGEQPEVFEAITKGAREGTTLQGVIEGLYFEVGKPPLPLDEKTAEWLRNLSTRPYGKGTLFEKPSDLAVNELRTPAELEYAQNKLELDRQLAEGKITKDAHDIELSIAYSKAYPTPPIPPYEPPIEKAIAQAPLWPRPASDRIIKFLKEMLWSPVDIGNLLRANIASFDMSFWRQQGPLIANHPIAFTYANIEAWKALVSQKSSEASFERITRSPLYQIYEVAAERGYDFIRPLVLAKGTSQWMGVEEFGYITQERLIPRLTGKIPHVKLSSRAFVTGTNEHNWRIFENHYKAMLRIQERIASGEIKLKPGESFSVEKEMIDMAKMLADFTQRASLGRVSGLTTIISGLMFAPRATLGRLLTPRHLVSANPRIRKEAWRNLSLWIAVLGGIVLLGEKLDLWEVEKDPRSAEFMSIRIGNTRIDLWSGYRQFLVFYVRVATGSGVSSVTGAEYDVDPIRALTTMARGKASPMASIFLDFWSGRNFIGEEVDITNPEQWLERLMPFALRDIYEAYKDDPNMAWPVVIPAIVGAGVQTYTGEWAENWLKLGLPKYSDNLIYGLTEPVYDAKDFWSDTASRFKGVDPETLTESKGFPPYIRAIAEAYNEILPQLDALPNQSLISLNADPEEGITFGQYYQMWLDREKIVASGDEEALKAFDADERTRNAHLGNMSQRQYALLVKYHSFTDDKEQADWLAGLDEEVRNSISENPRQVWLKSHPKENAKLAVWGQAKIYTLEAYKETQRLLKELDIPDAAIPEFILPPEVSVENYFKYNEAVEEFGANSAQAKIIVAQDDDLRDFLGRQPIDTPTRALELDVEWATEDDEYNALPIEDRDSYLAEHPDYAIARRKRDAYGIGFPEELIDTYIEWYTNPILEKPEGFEGTYYEDDWYLQEHPDFYSAMIDLEVWKERDFSKVPTREVFALYQEWQGLPLGTARRDFEATNPELDQWLHLKFGTMLESER